MTKSSKNTGLRARALTTTAILLVGVLPGTAFAAMQDAGPDAELSEPVAEGEATQISDIVVTGTSIRGVAPVGAPIRPMGQEELEASGVVSTADIVRALPQFISLGAQEGQGGQTQNAAANVTQGTGVNLRGLGTGSTLVLLNGRRMAPSGVDWQFNDVSMFPSGALQRVEVVADGASAIYGSDAVAGVVNFIFQKKFDGARTQMSFGGADGGAQQRQVSQTFGRTWDSGDLFFAYEHFERTALPASERAQLSADLRPFGGPDRRVNASNPGTIVVGGVTYAIPAGQDGRNMTAASLVPGTANYLDPADTRDFLADQVRDSLVFSIRQNLTDKLQISYDGFYGKRDFKNRGGSSSGSAGTTATLVVPRSNPFFVHPTNPAASSVSVNYSFQNEFPSYSHGHELSSQQAVGFSYDLWRDWAVEGYYSFNRSEAQRRAEGQLRTVNLTAALADSNPNTAFNPFGDRAAQNGDVIARLNGFSDLKTEYELEDFNLKASGTLFATPAGPVRAAIGAEVYYARGYSNQVRNTTTPAPVTTLDSRVERDVQAVFAEIFAPLVSPAMNIPFVQSLDLSIAGRFEEYSDFGSTSNPKIGLRWRPVNDLTLRTSYGTSFRAPTLKDIDANGSGTYNVVDFIDPQSTAANGLSHGIELLGGRPGIMPEEAETITVGADWNPTFAPGLRLSATYYNIDYTNRIETVPYATTLANPGLLGGYITRNPTPAQLQELYASPFYKGTPEPYENFVLIIDSRRKNLGGFRQSGLDLSASYDFTNTWGDWHVAADVTKILKAETALLPGAAYTDVLDTINNPISRRVRGAAGWSNDSWNVDVFVNYVGEYDNTLEPTVAAVDAWTTVDATVAYSFGPDSPGLDGVRVAVSAQNLFDKDPPVVLNGLMAFDSANHSILGRFINVSISKQW